MIQNGTQLNASLLTVEVIPQSAWNNGGAQTQTRGSNSGHLNIGYTHYYNGPFNGALASGTASSDVYRTLDFADLDSSNTSTFKLTLVIDAWQLNAGNTAGSNGRGVLFNYETEQAIMLLLLSRVLQIMAEIHILDKLTVRLVELFSPRALKELHQVLVLLLQAG